MRRILKSENGFTFFEVLTAVAIFSVGVIYVYNSFFKLYNVLDQIEYRNQATTLLENEIWETRKSYLSNNVINEDKLSSKNIDGKVYHLKIDSYVTPKDPYLVNLKVKVRWNEGNKKLNLYREIFINNVISK